MTLQNLSISDWERRVPFVELSEKTIRELFFSYLGKSVSVNIKPIENGKLNTNYYVKVIEINKEYLLRIHNEGARLLRKEKWITQLVFSKIPVPRYLYTDFTSDNILNKPFAIVEWLSGEHTTVEQWASLEKNSIESKAFLLGKLLAQLRNFTFNYSGFFNDDFDILPIEETPQNSYLDYINRKLQQSSVNIKLGDPLKNKLLQFINEFSPVLNQGEKRNFLVHGDFNFQNILFINKKITKAYLIDWEFSFSGSQLFDIGNMLRYDDKLPSNFNHHFISGYLSHGGYLPENWLLHAKLLDLLSLIDLISKIGEYPKLFSNVKQRIYRTVTVNERGF